MIDDLVHELRASTRPLVICDIDEVVLEFLDPFQDFLASMQYRLHADSFHLKGNVRSVVDGSAASHEAIHEFEETFFATQDRWQRPARNAKSVLDALHEMADIVFLTAMPPRHHAVRRTLLDNLDIRFPMISTDEAKGPIAAGLIGAAGRPSVFIDDLHTNLHSVRSHAPDCMLINMMASDVFRALAPPPGEGVNLALDWNHADNLIRAHFASLRAL
ncbi:hypothetical protein JJB09_04425 [Rhizobium sp. KVB221]|uniref:HAD family hydrolase n=1 Tax=Rhizobium setariae TaxID=2801340 RepID=A0A936YM52_9HYPH|nr:hypothetical protein [Rhizobium setariae]MBL0371267.1 hypothetical protein [Rhizobium setariae]